MQGFTHPGASPERAERARYRSTTRVRVCASVSNRQLGSGLEVPFKTSFAQLAELHTVSHSAATPARGNMPAATRVQFCVLVEVTWYPTDPPVYPRCERAVIISTARAEHYRYAHGAPLVRPTHDDHQAEKVRGDHCFRRYPLLWAK